MFLIRREEDGRRRQCNRCSERLKERRVKAVSTVLGTRKAKHGISVSFG